MRIDGESEPGTTSGMSPRAKIASDDYVKHHYYERTTSGRTELVVRTAAARTWTG